MATQMVLQWLHQCFSGIAARLRNKHNELTPLQVIEHIKNIADNIDDLILSIKEFWNWQSKRFKTLDIEYSEIN
jgi:hypothetical protein